MRDRFLSKIRREIDHAKAGRPARIIAKMNALQDPKIITTLYEASHAGVHIDLIIRGFCCLVPKVPGLSENIRVCSILGRFLEHSRIFWFQNAGNDEYFIGSADWMYRNLDYRVEAVAPIEEPGLRERLREILDTMLNDRGHAWELESDGRWVRRSTADNRPASDTHELLMARFLRHGAKDAAGAMTAERMRLATKIPMTKFPNPNKIPMTNTQAPDEHVIRHFRQQFDAFLGFGHWGLGFDWDLGTWSLGFAAHPVQLNLSHPSRRRCPNPSRPVQISPAEGTVMGRMIGVTRWIAPAALVFSTGCLGVHTGQASCSLLKCPRPCRAQFMANYPSSTIRGITCQAIGGQYYYTVEYVDSDRKSHTIVLNEGGDEVNRY